MDSRIRFKGGKLNQKDRNKFSQQWGKTKFRPKPYGGRSSGCHDAPAQEAEAATPWKHVKNDIIDSELAEQNAGIVNMESNQAKEFLKKREQNYRRNLIESKRNETTTWEPFDDNDNGVTAGKKNKKNNFKTTKPQQSCDSMTFKDRQRQLLAGQIKPEELTFKDRNFVRKKLTKGTLMTKGTKFNDVFKDLKSQMKHIKKSKK